MKHKSQSTYRNSDLARTKVKKNSFVALCSNLFMQQRSEIGLVEDRANSTTIIRIIVGLLLVHLIIIGGIILHGKINNEGGGGAGVESAIALEERNNVVEEEIPSTEPKPVEGPKVNQTTHITQVTDKTEPKKDSPVAVAPPVKKPDQPKPADKPKPAVNPTTPPKNAIAYTIKSGDALANIAKNHGVSVKEITAINPTLQDNPNNIVVGKTLWIPNKKAEASTAAAADNNDDAEFVEYTMKKGDTLSGIASKAGVKGGYLKLMEINSLTDKDVRRLQPGAKLKLPNSQKARDFVKSQKK